MSCSDLFTEEINGAQVLGRLRLDRGRHETLRGVMKNQQLVAIDRHGPEIPDLGVAERFELRSRQFVPVNVRNAGVIGTAVQVTPIRGKHEPFRNRVPEFEPMRRGDVARQQTLGAHDTQLHGLHAGACFVGTRERVGKVFSVRGNVDVEWHLAERKDVHGLPFGIGISNAHEHGEAVVRAQTPQ